MDEVLGGKRFCDYKEFKEFADKAVDKTKKGVYILAEGFVEIGYVLKYARDYGILYESGYRNMEEFARAEYNIDKSQASRYIAINDKFSEGGYSDQLKEQFRNFGSTKLTLMLNLPEVVQEALTPDLSKADIQAIKTEVETELNITPLEVEIEKAENPEYQEQEESILKKALKNFLHDNHEVYKDLFEVISKPYLVEDIADILCPGESKVDMTRIPGVGRLMISYYGAEKNMKVINIRSNEQAEFTWQDLENVLISIMTGDDVAAAWQKVYGESYPEKTEVAPVQREKQKSKVTKAVVPSPEPKKPLLHDVEPSIPEPDPVEPPEETEIVPAEPEKQIEGQDSIENHKEWMPEPVVDTTYEDVTESAETGQNGMKNVQNESETAHSEKKEILDKLYVLRQKVLNNNKADAEVLAGEILKKIGGWQP